MTLVLLLTRPCRILDTGAGAKTSAKGKAVTNDDIKTLAGFRLVLRQFQSFSEQAAEARGLTSQQYQALLAIKGEDGTAPFTVTLLAQRLLIKHNSAVGLVDRMEQLGLVAGGPCRTGPGRRGVGGTARGASRVRGVVEVTALGESEFRRLARAHSRELRRIAPELGRHFRHFAKPGETG